MLIVGLSVFAIDIGLIHVLLRRPTGSSSMLYDGLDLATAALEMVQARVARVHGLLQARRDLFMATRRATFLM